MVFCFFFWLFSQPNFQPGTSSINDQKCIFVCLVFFEMERVSWAGYSDFFIRRAPKIWPCCFLQIISHFYVSFGSPKSNWAVACRGFEETRAWAFFGRFPGVGNSLGNEITILTFELCIWQWIFNSFLNQRKSRCDWNYREDEKEWWQHFNCKKHLYLNFILLKAYVKR